MLFARGIILVEGDSEKFLIPVFAATMGLFLDHLGITVCSVAGTNFKPYAKFLTALGIPFSVITDWDPDEDEDKLPLGHNRALVLVATIEHARTGKSSKVLVEKLKAIEGYDEFGERCEEFGVFTNCHTLEVDLFNEGFNIPIIETLREHNFSAKKTQAIDAWEKDSQKLVVSEYLRLIERIGKGRFAQRLASRISGLEAPEYIKGAIEFVASRV